MWTFFLGLYASFLDKPTSHRIEVLPEQFPVPDMAQRFLFELLVVLYKPREDFYFYYMNNPLPTAKKEKKLGIIRGLKPFEVLFSFFSH